MEPNRSDHVVFRTGTSRGCLHGAAPESSQRYAPSGMAMPVRSNFTVLPPTTESPAGVTVVSSSVPIAPSVPAPRSCTVPAFTLAGTGSLSRVASSVSGFAVSAIAGLDCGTDREIGRLTPEDAAALVAQVDSPQADAIFISCTNFHCLSAVAEIERVHGKPVITSNLAGAWATLRYLGIDDDLPGAGRLFTLPARERMLAT